MHRNLFELNTITSHDINVLDFPMDEFGLFNCKIIVIVFHTPRVSVKHSSTFSLGAHNDTQNKFRLIHLMGSIISFTLTIVEGVHGANCAVHVKLNLCSDAQRFLWFMMPKQFTQKSPVKNQSGLRGLRFNGLAI